MDICVAGYPHDPALPGGIPNIEINCNDDWLNVGKIYCCGICNDTDEVGEPCTIEGWNSFGEPW